MRNYLSHINKGGLFLLLGIMLLEIVRSSMRDGDFIGYVRAGRLTIEGTFIYSDYLNTWPPFFSVFCVPLAWLDQLNGVLLRGTWTLMMLIALFYCMRLCIFWITGQKLAWPFQTPKVGSIAFSEPIALIPFLVIFRFVLDNQTNLQINIFLLLACLYCIKYWDEQKIILAAFLLALAISIKAYPIFLLFFFIYKQQYKLLGWSIIFLCFVNGIPFLVYGLEEASLYYSHWWNEIASPYPASLHKNQSFNAMLRNYFHADDSGLELYFNLVDIELDTLKKVGYAIIATAAIYPMYLFKTRFKEKVGLFSQLEFAFVFTAICILSPVAWKSNFIFLYPGYLLICYWTFFERNCLENKARNLSKSLFWISIVLNVFSSELFVGHYFSDVLESFSCITIGTILLLINLILIYTELKKTNLSTASIN